MTVEYVDLVDYIAIAAEVTGLDVETVMRVLWLDLADSALHAPAGRLQRDRVLPGLRRQGAVLIVHLVKNHPLPDGNKRAAWVAMRLFIEINGWSWREAPSVDDAEGAVLAIASGDWEHEQMSRWLRTRLRPPVTE